MRMKELINKLSTKVEQISIDIHEIIAVLRLHNDVLLRHEARLDKLDKLIPEEGDNDGESEQQLSMF